MGKKMGQEGGSRGGPDPPGGPGQCPVASGHSAQFWGHLHLFWPPLIWDQWKSNDEPPTQNHTIVLVHWAMAFGVILDRRRNTAAFLL